MKKPSFIIGKKQIILTCMTLMLGIAVYVNYALTDKEVPVKKSVSVNADISASEARLEKMTNRDEAVQTLQAIMGGGDITEDEMVTNALEAVEVSKLIESEGKIESLIKAQGMEDCVVYLDGKSAKVVVKTQGLDKAQAAAIKDIILGEVTVPAENIRVFEVK